MPGKVRSDQIRFTKFVSTDSCECLERRAKIQPRNVKPRILPLQHVRHPLTAAYRAPVTWLLQVEEKSRSSQIAGSNGVHSAGFYRPSEPNYVNGMTRTRYGPLRIIVSPDIPCSISSTKSSSSWLGWLKQLPFRWASSKIESQITSMARRTGRLLTSGNY